MMQSSVQTVVQPMPAELPVCRPSPMQVSLAFVDQRVNVWLRFAVFEPGAVCCRVKWIANDYGTALWQLMVLQAPTSFEGAQRIAGVMPGARILLRAEGELQVNAVLAAIDAMDQSGIDPCVAVLTYWGTVGNHLAACQPLPEYTLKQHAVHIARGALQ